MRFGSLLLLGVLVQICRQSASLPTQSGVEDISAWLPRHQLGDPLNLGDAGEATPQEAAAAASKGLKKSSEAEQAQEISQLRKSGIPEEAIDKARSDDISVTADGIKGTSAPPKKQPRDHSYVKFEKLTVPRGRVLMRKKGTLMACQNACTRASECKGIEYTGVNGGVCILLASGVSWSSTFDYFEKKSPDTADPTKVTKRDDALMWGRAATEKDVGGGLDTSDVPGSVKEEIHKPSKKTLAREEIRKLDKPVEAARIRRAAQTKKKLQEAQAVQSKMVMVLGETQDKQKRTAKVLQAAEARHAKEGLRAAKLNLHAARLKAIEARFSAEYKHAKDKTEEYLKANTAFTAAHNPMAATMKAKYLKWKGKLADLKLKSSMSTNDASMAKLRANTARNAEKSWKQQAEWAEMDELEASKNLASAERTKRIANMDLRKYAKEAKAAASKLPKKKVHVDYITKVEMHRKHSRTVRDFGHRSVTSTRREREAAPSHPDREYVIKPAITTHTIGYEKETTYPAPAV